MATLMNRHVRLVFALSGYLLTQLPGQESVVINEVHYHPELETDFVEFIEIYNASDTAVDLSGWSFSEGIDHVFAEGSMIDPSGFYILAQDESAYNRKFGSIFAGGVKADAQWDQGTLSNTGETLTLRDDTNAVIDQVDYQDEFPWPVSADGAGASMELIHPDIDNDLSGHWRAGAPPSPGKQNAAYAENPPPAIRQVDHSPQAPTATDTVMITAKATDADGVASMTLQLQMVMPGSYVRLMDDAYNSTWESLVMNDMGIDGDETADDSVYSATIPVAMLEHRRLIRYRIEGEDGSGQKVLLPYPDDPTPNRAFFVYDGVPDWSGSANGKAPRRTFTTEELTVLPVYHLIADADDVQRCQYRSADENRRFPGTLVYDGNVYDHIEFKVRGEFSTYQSGKNKWKFFFNRGNDFQARDNYGDRYPGGFRVMNFSACASPWVPANRGMSGLDEAVAFRMYALAGVPSPKTHHLHFRVVDEAEEAPAGDQYGGDLWGLYLSQEHPDGRFLNRRNLPDGSTYKIESGNGDQKHQGPFESNYRDFSSQAGRNQEVEWWEANMNLDAYYGFRAMNRVIGNIDIREGWNHYFYHHPNGRWVPVPWDLDMTFMPETHWSGTIDAKACLRQGEISAAFSSRCRELLDLLLADGSTGGGQAGSVVEELSQWLGTPKKWLDVTHIEKPTNGVVSITTAVPHGYNTGDLVTISGVTTTPHNGDFEIEVTGETTFTYKVSIFSPQEVGGTSIQAGTTQEGGSVWWEIDRAMWNEHPETRGGHKGNFYANPTTQNFRGGTLTRTLTSSDFSGFVQYVKDFITDTDPDDFDIGDGDQRGYGYNYLKEESDDGKAPDRPTISYTGTEGFPVDDLSFESGPFSGGTIFEKHTFTGMQWRVGEIYNPSTPNYESNTPWRYEITPVWESGTLSEFAPAMTLPNNALRPGSTYRVRVRFLNQLGGWSHWSEPIQFVAGEPDLSAYHNIQITELMYHPGQPSEAELTAGHRREDFEYLELHNGGSSVIDLTPIRFTKGIDFDFDSGTITMLDPGATIVIVSDLEAFQSRYGTDIAVAGEYSDNLSNGGERVKLSFGAGTPLIEFTYDDNAEDGWPSESDGGGKSLVRAGDDLSMASAWVLGETNGNPGRQSDGPPPPVLTAPLEIASVRRDQDGITIRWNAEMGKAYHIEYAALLGPNWQEIATLNADSTQASFTDTDAGRNGIKTGYYRLRYQP